MVNSLGPQISELVEDALASRCSDIVRHFWLIRNELQKLVELKFEFFSFDTFDVSQMSLLATSCTTEAQNTVISFSRRDFLTSVFSFEILVFFSLKPFCLWVFGVFCAFFGRTFFFANFQANVDNLIHFISP